MRNPKLNLLQPYIGVWKTEGKTIDGKTISGTDVYEWLDGEFFLCHKVDVNFGGEAIKSFEITHYDDMEDVFRTQIFDSSGNIGISTTKIIDDIILIFADGERFQGRFKTNSIEGSWEKCDGDEWKSWMEIKLLKQT